MLVPILRPSNSWSRLLPVDTLENNRPTRLASLVSRTHVNWTDYQVTTLRTIQVLDPRIHLTCTRPIRPRTRRSYKLHRRSQPTFRPDTIRPLHRQCTPNTINSKLSNNTPHLRELDNRQEGVYRWSIPDLWLMIPFEESRSINEEVHRGSTYRVRSRQRLPIIQAICLQEP